LRKPSERVKSVDLHPTQPWLLTGLYDGNVVIYNIDTGKVVKAFEIAPGTPVRCARFAPRQQWVVAGSDDFMLRAVNYNTGDKVAEVDAHADYIRFVEPHPTMGVILTASDDMTMRLWDTTNGFRLKHTFEGHANFVMMARFNPKDPITFASASLDRTVKVWAAAGASPIIEPNFTLDGHERGVNCVDYFHGGDRPYLISGADDHTLRIWDYQTRSCVTVLQGHTDNVSAVLYHPRLPLIISGSEDGSVRVWHAATYKVESTLSYGMDRCWTLGASAGSNRVAMGFDGGAVVAALGDDVPISSMDRSGKLVTADNNQIALASVRSAIAQAASDKATAAAAATAAAGGAAASASSAAAPAIEDGARLELSFNDMGSIDMYPRALAHNSNGRFVAALGDNEFVIYTAQALRSKSFGRGRDLAWSSLGSGDYAVLDTSSRVVVNKNFAESFAFRLPFAADKLRGGALLAAQRDDCVQFWAWEQEMFVMQVDAECTGIVWSEAGDFVALSTPDATYVLAHNKDAVMAASLASGDEAARIAAEGVEGALAVVHELTEKIVSAQWAGDCLIFVTARGKLCYFVGGRTITVAHLPDAQHILGYLPKEGRVVLQDRSADVFTYALSWPLLEYQTAVVRRDFDRANAILPGIPTTQHTRIAKFLEAQGFKEEALAVSTDPEHRFELAIGLNRLDVAYAITTEAAAEAEADAVEVESRWRQLADLALAGGDIKLALECAEAGNDHSSLLLIYTSLGHAPGLERLAEEAEAAGRANVALAARLALSDAHGAVGVLLRSGRAADAAIFARSHAPSLASDAARDWIGQLKARAAKGDRGAERAAEAIAVPDAYPNLFPGWDESLDAEASLAAAGALPCPSASHSAVTAFLDAGVTTPDAIGDLAAALSGAPPTAAAAPTERPASPSPVPRAHSPASPAPEPAAQAAAASAAAPAAASAAPPTAPEPEPEPESPPRREPSPEPEYTPEAEDAASPQPESSPQAAASPEPEAPPVPEPAPAPAPADDGLDDLDFGDDLADAPATEAAAPPAPAADDDFDLDLDMDFE